MLCYAMLAKYSECVFSKNLKPTWMFSTPREIVIIVAVLAIAVTVIVTAVIILILW